MALACFRFYAELNDFLPPGRQKQPLRRRFDVSGSVKDFIESFGVPHTEVDLVLVNGEPAPFSRLVLDGDRVSVYPLFTSLDIAAVTKVRSGPMPSPRFVLDVHLGRLAAYLRMAGFDALYRNDSTDEELAQAARDGSRALLTRDRWLLMRSGVEWGYWVRSTVPRQQLEEVMRRFGLLALMAPFSRCMVCNGVLEPVSREEVLHRIPPGVQDKPEFRRCPHCGGVYWKGTHHARMTQLLDWLRPAG
jgi:uncharacterized protein with PIN domain